MIRLTDATVLALTKLRTRKIRTIITIVMSALVFAILIGSLAVTQGVFKSLTSFSHEGLNDRYLVMATKAGGLEDGIFTKPALIERSKQLYDEVVADKKAYAAQLGLAYDATAEPLPYTSRDGDPKNNRLMTGGPTVERVFNEYYGAQPKVGLSQLQTAAAPYHPKAVSRSQILQGADGTIMTMQQGSEAFLDPAADSHPGQGDDPVFGRNINIGPAELTAPFLLPGSTWQPSSDAIPVIVTQTSAEKLLNLKSLPKNATPSDQLQRIADVRSRAASIGFAACYRNSVSRQQVDKAVLVPDEIKKNRTNKDYALPSLQYGLPAADTCEVAVIKQDTRSVADKQLAVKQAQFDEKFGAVVAPIQQKIQFQVVGITPDPIDYAPANTVDGLIAMVVGASSLGMTTIPQQLYDQLPVAAQHADILTGLHNPAWLSGDTSLYVSEFTSADDARAFIDQQSCSANSTKECAAQGKPFQMGAFGSNSIALDDLQIKVTDILKIAFLVAAGVALAIMGGMISRTVADGRRETAVFRAIGFKRIDITSVYVVYTFLLSLYVALAALVAGVVAAYILDQRYWQTLTVKARLSFGASEPTREFHLFALDSLWMWLVVAGVVVLGFISMIIPLLRNVRRNPIKDMRDE